MKKLLLLAALFLGTALLAGCDRYIETEPKMTSRTVTITDGDWEYVTDEMNYNGYLQCDVEMSMITRDVCREGVVMVYWLNGDLQEVVSSVLWIDDWNGHVFGQAVSYAFSPGWIRFYYARDDFDYRYALEDMKFRVVAFE